MQLLVLQLIEIERRGGGILHEGHRRITGGVEDPILIVWETLGIVEPTRHTHIDSRWMRPICSNPLALGMATMALFVSVEPYRVW